MRAKGLWSVGPVAGLAITAPRLAVLSDHDPRAWSNSSCAGAGASACNLRLYQAAIATSAAVGASFILFPEAYGLSPGKETEPWVSEVGSLPCAASRDAPLQSGIACAAAAARVPVVANIFARLSNGTAQIRDVVFDASGAVIASYAKRHLFPNEAWPVGEFSASKEAPVTVEIAGVRCGLLICFEGVYPDLTRDWSQLLELRRQGAEVLLWSVGGDVPLRLAGERIVKEVGLPVVASMDRASAAIIGAAGTLPRPGRSLPLSVPGYTGAASLLLAALPLARRGPAATA